MRAEQTKIDDIPTEAAVSAPQTRVDEAAGSSKRAAGRLTEIMALPEPARTEGLEQATNSGATVNLRTRTGKELRWRYGEHVLVVTAEPKPFAAPHAIHLLFSAPQLVEEVGG